MNQPPEVHLSLPVLVGGVLFTAAGLAVWWLAVYRVNKGLPVVPYERRRPVPWQALHVATIAAAYLVLTLLVQRLDVKLFDLPVPGPAAADSERPILQHPLLVLLEQSRTPGTLLLCFFSAVIVAPIVEEFLFRLVLQGWLESVEMRRRRGIPALRKLTRGAVPVVLVALLFAAIHYRPGLPPGTDPRTIAHLMASNAVAGLLVLVLGVGLLRLDAGARAEDLGCVPRKLLADIRLGVLTFLAFAAAIYLLKNALTARWQENVADPVTLFAFALVLGALYSRTHRVIPSIALHMSLNFTSLAMAWFRVGM